MNKKIKKLLALVCVVILVTSILAGCGKVKSDEGTTTLEETTKGEVTVKNQTLEVAMFEGGYSGFWRSYIDKFQAENPGVTIKSEINPKIADALRPRFMSGDVPDFIGSNITPNLDPRILAKEGQLLDITELMSQTSTGSGTNLKDSFWPGVIDVAKVDDKIYFAPSGSGLMGTFYNAKLFKDMGVDVPKTLDDAMKIGEVIKAKGDKSLSLLTYAGIYPGYLESTLFPSMASGKNGFAVFEKIANNESGAWKQEEVIKTLKYLEDMAKNGYIASGTTAINHTQSQQSFLTGKVGFIPNGNWLENEMKDTKQENFEWGFIPTLTLEAGGKSYLSGSVEAIYIPKNAKNPELAKKFLTGYFNNEAIKMGAKYGIMVPMNGVVELIKESLSPSILAMLSAQEAAKAEFKLFTFSPEYAKIQAEFDNAITDIVNMKTTAEQAAEKIGKVAAEINN